MRLGCRYGGAVSGWESGALLGLSDESATGGARRCWRKWSLMLLGGDAKWLPSLAGREDAGEAELLLPIAREGIVAAQRGRAEQCGRGTERLCPGAVEGVGKPSVHTLDSVGTPAAPSLQQASCLRPPSSSKSAIDAGCFKTHLPGKPRASLHSQGRV